MPLLIRHLSAFYLFMRFKSYISLVLLDQFLSYRILLFRTFLLLFWIGDGYLAAVDVTSSVDRGSELLREIIWGNE